MFHGSLRIKAQKIVKIKTEEKRVMFLFKYSFPYP
jgi:hypothetical protein